jgi:hypothetical protein
VSCGERVPGGVGRLVFEMDRRGLGQVTDPTSTALPRALQ